MLLKKLIISSAIALAGFSLSTPSNAGTNEYIGQIMMGAWNFCPRGSTQAEGQLLPIASNTALFSLYGTTYGGDGRTTFALPDLRGRIPIGNGRGAGLTDRRLGSEGGLEFNIMTESQMPRHRHVTGIRTSNTPGNTMDPAGNSFTVLPANGYATADPLNSRPMDDQTVGMLTAGQGQPQNNMQPFLAIKFCVVREGIFPSRN